MSKELRTSGLTGNASKIHKPIAEFRILISGLVVEAIRDDKYENLSYGYDRHEYSTNPFANCQRARSLHPKDHDNKIPNQRSEKP